MHADMRIFGVLLFVFGLGGAFLVGALGGSGGQTGTAAIGGGMLAFLIWAAIDERQRRRAKRG